jgi:hypothetical protein
MAWTPPKGERGGACTAMDGGGAVAKAGTAGTREGEGEGAGAEHGRIACLDEANGPDSRMAEREKAGYP